MPTLDIFLNTLVRDADTCADGCLRNWKIGFGVLLFIEGLVFGHLVYLIKRVTSSSSKNFSYVFHLGNALSAGVFFAAGVLHILPEAIALISGEHGDEHGDGHEGDHEGDHGDGDEHDHERWISLRQVEDEEIPEDESEEGHSDGFPWAFLILMLSFYGFFFLERILLPKLLRTKSALDSEQDEEVGQLKKGDDSVEEEDVLPVTSGFRSQEFMSGLIQILGISAHSLFESVALGLSGSFSTVLNIFIATVSHRWATSAALGFKLLKTLNYLPFLVLLLLFSAIVPLGIGIGAALGSLSETVQGVLFSISAGTFIYIGVYEVMADEFVEHKKWPLTKFLMTLIGASSIIVVTVILNVLDIHG